MAVTLPVVLLILDWYPCQRLKGLKVYRGVLIEKLPFFVLSLGSSIITVLAQRSGKAVMSLEFAPLALRIIVGVKTFIAYLWKILLPLNLTPFYPYPRSGSFLSLKYLGPILLVIGITAFCIVVLKRQRLWLAVWSYYVITLLPVSGIIQVGFQSMADRYTYLPSLGPFFVIGLVVTLVYERVSTSEKWGLVFKVFSAAIVVVLMWLSIQQIGVWKDSLTLWNYVIKEKSVKNPVAYYHRGIAYYEDGKYDRAIEDYTTAIALNPDYFEAYNNRGVTHGRKGEYNRAIEDYDMAIALSQDFRVYNNRGNTYITKGLLERAIEDFNKAIAINPDSDEAYSSRGIACYLKGQYDKAFEDFKKAIELNQNNAEAYINLGYVYLQMGNRELAISDLQKGCNLGNKNGCKTLQNLLNNNLRQ
ncbi:MAG: tetratricopeptide repeat protein [Nitrospirae bacterium]|nr:tetratricopeptide repeat protein [Nitrospirota bacterium]